MKSAKDWLEVALNERSEMARRMRRGRASQQDLRDLELDLIRRIQLDAATPEPKKLAVLR